jgi:hypothetical protein
VSDRLSFLALVFSTFVANFAFLVWLDRSPLTSSLLTFSQKFVRLTSCCWCSSVVEQLICNQPVASSNLVTSFFAFASKLGVSLGYRLITNQPLLTFYSKEPFFPIQNNPLIGDYSKSL